jgi:hypothetical protein
MNLRPKTNNLSTLQDQSKGRYGRTIDQESYTEDRPLSNLRQSQDTASVIRERTLHKLRRERKLSRANLIDAIKDMNESQLNSISNIIKVRINKGKNQDGLSTYESEGPYEITSLNGETEADELNDKVEEL